MQETSKFNAYRLPVLSLKPFNEDIYYIGLSDISINHLVDSQILPSDWLSYSLSIGDR